MPRSNPHSITKPSIDKKRNRKYTAQDFIDLNVNEHYRYAPNSKRIGHAVFLNGQALQYALPAPSSSGDPQSLSQGYAPELVTLKGIEQINRFGMTRWRAKDEDGKSFYARRVEHGRLIVNGQDTPFDLAYFSEEEKTGKEPFWGSSKPVPKFRKDLPKADQAEWDAVIAEAKVTQKGGTIQVDPESVEQRDKQRKRNPDQNTVMGESARDAYEHFFSKMEDVLTPELIFILKRSFQADIKKTPENQFRPEWLHALGFSLMPMDQDPQTKANLGAAGKWANTEMMVLERIAKWMSQHKTDVKTEVKTLYTMLLDSELIDHIKFEVSFEFQQRYIHFIQELDTFKKFPLFRKASDLAQATGITHAILNGEQPYLTQAIKQEGNHRANVISSTLTASKTQRTNDFDNVTRSTPMSKSSDTVNVSPSDREDSIVQITTTHHEPDYNQPWNGTEITKSRGTGFVIEHNGEKFVLTNAHCVENLVRSKVRFANDSGESFSVEPIQVAYQCDLALLRVKSKTFQAKAQPVELGQMVKHQEGVQAMGFPMGGEELSITRGIVSRIEVGDYAMSGLEMLQVQVDAAINPGNSGGPVFSGDKVVGVAFQGYDAGQNLGYIIPMPIVNHFLNEVFSGKPYRGFPVLPIDLQTLENKELRKHYGMQPNQSGVRLRRVNFIGDAHEKLVPGDVLLEIDGLTISNRGTVDIPDFAKCIDLTHLTHMKYVGDSVCLKVLRKNKESGLREEKMIEVKMDQVPLETGIVPQNEFDKMPTYYINSGAVFIPVSRNYIQDRGLDLGGVLVDSPEYGSAYLSEMPKKFAEQQLVAVSHILECSSTENYDNFENRIVKKVNGTEIRNLAHLIEVMESNKSGQHTIELGGGDMMVLKQLSDKRFHRLLERYKIQYDRSEDLRPHPHMQPAMSSADSSSEESDSDHSLIMSLSEGSSTETEEDNSEKVMGLFRGADGMTPGQRRNFKTLQKIEAHYKDVDDDNDLLSDDESEEENIVPGQKHSSKAQSSGHQLRSLKRLQPDDDDSSDDEVVVRRPKPKLRRTHDLQGRSAFAQHGFFNQSSMSASQGSSAEQTPKARMG